jgi:HK97 family phage portal protein
MFGLRNPFKRRDALLSVPLPTVEKQLGEFVLALKSLSLPQSTPRWRLFAFFQKDWVYKAAVEEGYKASTIVYSAVEKRARSLSSVRMVAEQKVNGEWTAMPESRLQLLLDNPNPDMDQADFLHRIEQMLCIGGNSFITEIRGGIRSEPITLWPLNPQYMKIKPGQTTLVDYYEYEEGTGQPKRVDNADMIHIQLPNPDSWFYGMPILQGAAKPVDIDRESGEWQKNSLQNRGVSDVNIKLPDNATQAHVDIVKEAYKERQAGPKNARKPWITNAEFQTLDRTAVEMDFVQSRKATWTEIAAAFGTPLAILGFTEDVNLNNAKTMRKLFWQDTMQPEADLVARQLTSQLAHDFGKDWRVRADYSNVAALQEDLGERLDNARKVWDMGIPFDDINQRFELGFDDVDGGDVGYMSAALVPVGFEPEEPALDPTQDPPALPAPDDEKGVDEFRRAIKMLAYGKP